MSARNTTHAQQVLMIERHLAGERLEDIAADMQFNFYTVRKWWRLYRDKGWSALIPKPPGLPPDGALRRFDPMVEYVALRLKREHPRWGLDLLLLHLARRESLRGIALPSRTALYNYLCPYYSRIKGGLSRLSQVSYPTEEVCELDGVHQRWQMDFKGEVQLSGAGEVKPFNVCDEFSSAPLGGIIHLKRSGRGNGLTSRDVQVDLRKIFSQWGLPQQLRMDRDSLWVGSSRMEWPGVVLLWVVGLGITPMINPPGSPTQNAQIERCNRTWREHVYEGNQHLNEEELQAFTDQAWQNRREVLPSHNHHCQGKPPFIAYPELTHSGRYYSLEQEEELFDMQRVYDYLSQWEWQRTVNSSGCIYLAKVSQSVGRQFAKQIVKIHFDSKDTKFVASAVDGTELRRFTIPTISKSFILNQNAQGVWN
jgi:transposase InsO family protein